MGIQDRVLYALSEAIWGDPWPAEYIKRNLISELTTNSRRIIRLASLLIEVSPILSRARPFSRLSRELRLRWMNNINPKGLTKDMLGILEFLLSAVYFVNSKNASKIGYKRETLVNCIYPSKSERLSNDPRNIKKRYDVIVVGSGAGGAAAAWRLASVGLKVVVFEAGPEPRDIIDEHPVTRAVKYYWDNGLTFTMGKPALSLPFGKVLGGTVTVNSGTMFRIPNEVLGRWRDETGAKIDSGMLEKAYQVVEEKLGVQIVPEELLGGNADVMRKGAKELGLSHYPVKRPLGECCGAGECAFVCPYHGKRDMRITFLRDGKRLGLEIYCSTSVKKIVKRGHRVIGVVINLDGHEKLVGADAVVVSAGALNTPILLRKMGLKNRNLGKHLHIHPAVGVTALMDRKVYGWRGTMQSYCVDTLFKEYHTLLLATFPPPGIGYSAGSIPLSEIDKYPFLASIGVQCSDDGEGHIPRIRPFGVASYSISQWDLEKVKRGVMLATEILLAAGAEKIYLPLKKMVSVKSLSEASKLIDEIDRRYFKLSAYHPMSTARMGRDEANGVVDREGRVYGFENLYVADASILPSTTYVNPQLTINALSLIVAEYILRNM